MSNLVEYEFGDFYPKDGMPPEGRKCCPLQTHCELKNDLRKKYRLVVGGNRLDASGHTTLSSMVKNISAKLLSLIAAANNLKA